MHVNIPVFIPHLGCPNMCVFCNQRAISGVCSFISDQAKETIETVLSTVDTERTECEIAFFGGSFTGIDRELMISLLDLAESYVRLGNVSGIRMSTRPDYIDSEICRILSDYTISAVELGLQSFADPVLETSKRGHTAAQSENAVRLLQDAGFSVVGQMMIGLPASSPDDERMTAEKIVSLGIRAVRIYPTVVFRQTELETMMLDGRYHPLTLDEAVSRSADVLGIFVKNHVECLRIGLCESENLHAVETYCAGPNHPALGELVSGELYFNRIAEKLDQTEILSEKIIIEVPKGEVSKAVGHKKRNIEKIRRNYPVKNIKFIENPSLTQYNIVLAFYEAKRNMRVQTNEL